MVDFLGAQKQVKIATFDIFNPKPNPFRTKLYDFDIFDRTRRYISNGL